ncbi:hypothetical protein LJD61_01905 [Lutispora thermophila]|uniref:Uncharacterized protein n=1 Tax=Lutispora saccharofermentans TaxID=3024236 RepID=A0ABT1NCD4_9FIRM|nr:hypothetical protein [Lutispora saccharofermentans]MCQ1528304.1 hypothetical protein [Lutispora saccharofermentans]
MYNPSFKVAEFDHFKMQAGLPTFVLSAKQWIEKTNAIGLYVQAKGTNNMLQLEDSQKDD